MRFIQKDFGGLLQYDLGFLKPGLWDIATTPTVTLFDPSGTIVLLAEQDATPGPATTVGTGGAVADQKVVSVDDSAGMTVGTREEYVIGPSTALGQWEMAELVGVGVGEVRLRHPLRYAYAEGDPIRSTRLSVLVEGSEATTVYENAQARWTYYVGGRPYTKTSLFSVAIWDPGIPVTTIAVLRLYPQALNEMADSQALEDLLFELWDQLLDDLAMKAGHASRLVSGQSLRTALIKKLMIHLPFVNREAEQMERAVEEFTAEWSKVCQLATVDLDGSGSITTSDRMTPSIVGNFYRA